MQIRNTNTSLKVSQEEWDRIFEKDKESNTEVKKTKGAKVIYTHVPDKETRAARLNDNNEPVCCSCYEQGLLTLEKSNYKEFPRVQSRTEFQCSICKGNFLGD